MPRTRIAELRDIGYAAAADACAAKAAPPAAQHAIPLLPIYTERGTGTEFVPRNQMKDSALILMFGNSDEPLNPENEGGSFSGFGLSHVK